MFYVKCDELLKMALLTHSWIWDLVTLGVVVLTSLYLYFSRKYQHWAKRNVKHTNPKMPYGDLSEVGKSKNFAVALNDLYGEYKNEKILGAWMFFTPILLINDPELIKTILVKDFNYFQDRGFRVDEELEPLAGHLFTMNGQKWRNLRIKLTPTFTSGKMKMMLPTMVDVGENLKLAINEAIQEDEVVEMKDMTSRFTTDVIASVAFGLDVSSLKNPNSEFRQISQCLTQRTYLEMFISMLTLIWPKAVTVLKLHVIPKSVTTFFLNAVKETIEYREKNNVKKNDFMQLLIQLKDKGFIEDADAEKKEGENVVGQPFSVEQAAAQAFVFLIAGFETSAATIQFALYELALQPDLQKKLTEEIDRVIAKHNGQITYDGLQEMTLLDRVVSETLRKYPAASVLLRECTKEYNIPDTNTIIDKGTLLIFPIMGIQYDPEYYPEPDRFDPDRFTAEEKEKRHHYTYLPFGEGPRMCIGNRFGLQQTKVGIAIILSTFQVDVCEETVIPMCFDPQRDLLSPKGGMHLKVTVRS